MIQWQTLRVLSKYWGSFFKFLLNKGLSINTVLGAKGLYFHGDYCLKAVAQKKKKNFLKH